MNLASFPARPLALAVAGALALVPLSAAALSKRDQAAVDALGARMKAAEERYARAVSAFRNADPAARHEADEALEDMEDVIADCARQRGCQVVSMVTPIKRLLKQGLDGETEDDEDDAGDGHAAHAGIAADVPEAARAAALLSEDHRFDRMVEFNPAVQQGIRRWLTDMRGPLMNSYENYQTMRHLMWPQFERAGLPEALLFGILAKESNGRVHATSRAGAAGPLQFMPATGRRFGLGNDGSGFDTRYDPRAAAMASAEYLNERMRELNRNIELALAGYNGGEGRAGRVYRESGGRSFWDESVYNQFPAETRDYVPMVIAAAWLFLHPKEYGITWPKVDARPTALRLAQPSSIYQLTICLGNSGTRDGYMRALRNLNPRYEADQVLPAGTTLQATTRIVGLYNRWCTGGARAELARMLVMSDPSRAIVRASGLLPVPPAGLPAPAAAPVEAGAAAEDAVTAGRPPNAAVRPAPRAVQRDYRVQAGETLTSIARKFDCRVTELARANQLDDGKVIRPGQTLRLEGCRG
ncbi:transglycosylase SLT domain-containing protein [Lysobacter sp. N42]|uniref:transglycosylase SLT domain-containing protein n=1 Tax=Lysobacter sp. N42 TaxID=2545719 RepID=UPI00104A4EE1|nr:transglycosylase SLT domain-containing protein [Lysobacter sp. N42]TCZ87405.1 LysM peptidoglycan-binding domain-containing protein [Lysobacter sp. N42]